MNIEEALRDLTDALAAADGVPRRDAGLRAARRVLVERCKVALGLEVPSRLALTEALRLAAAAPGLGARRFWAVLVVHALAVPGLVPASAANDVCRLAESALRDVLLRCGYPFGGSVEEKMRVLERLHVRIGDLMQPMEPTFPSWIQGLHAG